MWTILQRTEPSRGWEGGGQRPLVHSIGTRSTAIDLDGHAMYPRPGPYRGPCWGGRRSSRGRNEGDGHGFVCHEQVGPVGRRRPSRTSGLPELAPGVGWRSRRVVDVAAHVTGPAPRPRQAPNEQVGRSSWRPTCRGRRASLTGHSLGDHRLERRAESPTAAIGTRLNAPAVEAPRAGRPSTNRGGPSDSSNQRGLGGRTIPRSRSAPRPGGATP